MMIQLYDWVSCLFITAFGFYLLLALTKLVLGRDIIHKLPKDTDKGLIWVSLILTSLRYYLSDTNPSIYGKLLVLQIILFLYFLYRKRPPRKKKRKKVRPRKVVKPALHGHLSPLPSPA